MPIERAREQRRINEGEVKREQIQKIVVKKRPKKIEIE